MKKIIYSALLFIVVSATSLFAQAPSVKWQKCLGGIGDDHAYTMAKTTDGGYILAGATNSYDEDVLGHYPDGLYDIWVVKLTSLGIIEWQKCLGGNEYDFASSIIQCADGGYAVAGYTSSDSGDVIGKHSLDDMWVVKLDNSGSIQWQKCLGGSLDEYANSIIQTFDGGYVIVGETNSNDGDVSGRHQSNIHSIDAWVVKLTSDGQIQWQKPLGGSGREAGESIVQLQDSSFVLVGSTSSSYNDGDVSGIHGELGSTDGWLVKLSPTGNIVSQKCIGSDSGDYFTNIIATDGGFLAMGLTNGYGDTFVYTYGDFWVIRLDDSASTLWQYALSGSQGESAVAATKSKDDGYIVCGSTYSSDNSITDNHGELDIILLKLTADGKAVWQKCYGGSKIDYGFGVIQNDNGSIVIGGRTYSQDGDVSGRHGVTSNYDFWIAELTTPESVEDKTSPLHSLSLSTYPNPASKSVTLRYVLPVISSDVAISITDINGKQMRKLRQANVMQGNNDFTIDVSELSEGTYYITLSAEGLSETTVVQVVK